MLFDILFFGFSLFIVYFSYIMIFQKKGDKKPQIQVQQQQVQEQVQQQMQPRNQRNVQNYRQRRQEVVQQQNDDDTDGEEEQLDTVGMNKKEIMKEQKRQEKAQQREAFQQQLQEQENQRNKKLDKYEERARLREEAEAKKEEEDRIRLEEIAKKEQEEYDKWKNMFKVEEKGTDVMDEMQAENLIQKFIEYIKLRKVVMLDDLASNFNLTTKDVIDRIQRLEETKQLTGVIDERGKYIYITDNELQAVSNYIKMKGRVNRSDLILECNKIIKCNPSEKVKQFVRISKDKIKIQQEEEEMRKIAQIQLKDLELIAAQ